jgi:nucleotide-binding universal stress UspA family protein
MAVSELPLDPGVPRTFGTAGDIAEWEGQPLEAPPDVVDHLTEARDRLASAGVGAQLGWAVGSPAGALVDAARDAKADVIILGEHHHSLLGSFFGADTAAEVRERAGCDVVLA